MTGMEWIALAGLIVGIIERIIANRAKNAKTVEAKEKLEEAEGITSIIREELENNSKVVELIVKAIEKQPADVAKPIKASINLNSVVKGIQPLVDGTVQSIVRNK